MADLWVHIRRHLQFGSPVYPLTDTVDTGRRCASTRVVLRLFFIPRIRLKRQTTRGVTAHWPRLIPSSPNLVLTWNDSGNNNTRIVYDKNPNWTCIKSFLNPHNDLPLCQTRLFSTHNCHHTIYNEYQSICVNTVSENIYNYQVWNQMFIISIVEGRGTECGFLIRLGLIANCWFRLFWV